MIRVVCGIILDNKKVFICRRVLSKSLGGYWEFPGGKIEENESPEFSLIRELREELNMIIEIENYFATNIHDYGDFQIELISYQCKFITAEYEMTDHDKFEWVHPPELLNWQLAPADIPIAKKIIEKCL